MSITIGALASVHLAAARDGLKIAEKYLARVLDGEGAGAALPSGLTECDVYAMRKTCWLFRMLLGRHADQMRAAPCWSRIPQVIDDAGENSGDPDLKRAATAVSFVIAELDEALDLMG